MNNVNSVYRAIANTRSRYTHRTVGHLVPVVHSVHAVHAKHHHAAFDRPPRLPRDLPNSSRTPVYTFSARRVYLR